MSHFIGQNVLFQRHFLILHFLRICRSNVTFSRIYHSNNMFLRIWRSNGRFYNSTFYRRYHRFEVFRSSYSIWLIRKSRISKMLYRKQRVKLRKVFSTYSTNFRLWGRIRPTKSTALYPRFNRFRALFGSVITDLYCNCLVGQSRFNQFSRFRQ